MALVGLANAKAHLREVDEAFNVDIQQKADHASALVLARCNTTAWWRDITPTWTEATVPGEVQSAVLVVLTHLWKHRGDDMQLDESLWAAVDRLLAGKKDPVIA